MKLELLAVLAVAIPAAATAENLDTTAQPRKVEVIKVASFDYGRLYVHTEERHELFHVAQLWKQQATWSTITVEGHGFVEYDEEASIALGEKRAQRVRDLLVKYGVDPRFVTAIGHSRKQPGRYVDVIVDTCESCRR